MQGPWLGILAFLVITRPLFAAGAASAPSFAVAHDTPLEATEKEVGRADGIIQLRVEFRGIKGDRVPAFLWLPEEKADAPKRPRTAVLTQYGRGGDKSTDYIVALAKGLAGAGFVALTIDAPYRGERGPEPKDIQFFTSDTGKEVFLQYLGDYSRAVDYLVSRKEVDAAASATWARVGGRSRASPSWRTSRACGRWFPSWVAATSWRARRPRPRKRLVPSAPSSIPSTTSARSRRARC